MKIIVQNLVVNYSDEGDGRTLLFLHGWQDSLCTFDALASFFANEYRIVRLDLPGFGESELQKGDWDLNRYATFVADFAGKLNLELYAMAGHSFGGRIAVAGLAREALRARKLVLLNSGGLARRKTLKIFLLKIVAKVGWFFVHFTPLFFWSKKLRLRLYEFIGSRDYPNAGALRKTFLNIISEDLTEDARKLTLPTLIIWGEKDQTTPIFEGQMFAELIKDSKLQVLSGVGHMAHQEKPQEVAQAMRKFLDS